MPVQDAMPEKDEEKSATVSEGDEEDVGTETPDGGEEKFEKDHGDEDDAQDEELKDIDEEEMKPKMNRKEWPLRDIKEPGDNDVLFGRGGGTNHAKGNKRYRQMVEDRKLEYVNSKRLDKPLVALEIIRLWRAQDPPGRFLKLDSNGLWSDVGDKKAREKTSQALREKAPQIRKQQEEEKLGSEEGGSPTNIEKDQSTKNTRFAEGTNTETKGKIKKAVLARDHSLGREYLQAGETMNLEGFSWREPLEGQSTRSEGSRPPPLPRGEYPVQRMSSGSMGMPPPEYRVPSTGAPPTLGGQPRQGAYFHHPATEEYGQPYPSAPGVPGYTGYGPHQRSGSWTHNAAHAMPPLREHSLSQNPLRNASANHVAPVHAFDSRNGSGYWGDRAMPPPPGQAYSGPYREGGGTYPPPLHPRYDPHSGPSSMMPPPPPPAAAVAQPYSVDPAIAKTWSCQSDGDEDVSNVYDKGFGKTKKHPQTKIQHNGFGHDRNDQSHLLRPQIVKRMTSHQNETLETKKDLVGPSVKRAALNRDNSLTANRLKEAHLPEYYIDGNFDSEKEVNVLSNNLEQSTLGTEKPSQKAFGATGRTSTLENIAMDLMTKPAALSETSRSSTIDALALDDLESDPVIRPDNACTGVAPKPSALSAHNRLSTMEACFAELEEVTAKPLALTGADRVSTRDYLDIGDEPLDQIEIDRVEGGSDELLENDSMSR